MSEFKTDQEPAPYSLGWWLRRYAIAIENSYDLGGLSDCVDEYERYVRKAKRIAWLLNARFGSADLLQALCNQQTRAIEEYKGALRLIADMPSDATAALIRCQGYARATLKKWAD